ncbi:polysaccharide pyruvyl transferase family protein [Pelagicoccus sp. SDUM812003]|uniref:polysaccharide pyruvyl transferase family protein n=1 Tax=Pelagicoccus sp. SDUM812003 TaxID=3041267 RepID=UPI00280E22DF|nr:polysaccharide pyruvyl transferase family protein [Pelagicoccus sp. SDUM812003]MDQ8204658.1 polysaccharide pyruvyl transferase family protein [Pelagicoccus sp. SDUM812003]
MKKKAYRTIELTGAAFRNKGAELMLRTAVFELRERLPNCQLAINHLHGTAEQKSALGLRNVVWLHANQPYVVRNMLNGLATFYGCQKKRSTSVKAPDVSGSGLLTKTVGSLQWARKARDADSLLPSDIDIALDLAGYAYGEAFGAERILRSAVYYEQIKKRGGAVVLLPQQIGPFQSDDCQQAFARLANTADLLFARDRLSFEAALPFVEPSKLRLSPDFTTRRHATSTREDLVGRACVIPNYKMVTHTESQTGDTYREFLSRSLSHLKSRNTKPYLLIHDSSGQDIVLARELQAKYPDTEIVLEEDPFKIKAIISTALVTIGSRFHGLVNALSQAVPSLGTSWSHKYRMLFEDYDCSECLVDVDISPTELRARIDYLLTSDSRENLIQRLRIAETARKGSVDRMWQEIIDFIRTPTAEKATA